jgi:hypothetical protein
LGVDGQSTTAAAEEIAAGPALIAFSIFHSLVPFAGPGGAAATFGCSFAQAPSARSSAPAASHLRSIKFLLL